MVHEGAALYIAFEGGEGSGKSTQARLLAERLGARITHEPGGTDLGVKLRKLLLGVGESPVGSRAETLLMAADRAQHMVEVVGPTLAGGQHVVSDRTAYSSLAYQGGGRNLGVDDVRAVNDWALDGLWPDLVVLLDCERSATNTRLDRALDRLEAEESAFHDRVRSTFLALAADDRDHWVVIDGAGTIDEVASQVWEAVQARVAGGEVR